MTPENLILHPFLFLMDLLSSHPPLHQSVICSSNKLALCMIYSNLNSCSLVTFNYEWISHWSHFTLSWCMPIFIFSLLSSLKYDSIFLSLFFICSPLALNPWWQVVLRRSFQACHPTWWGIPCNFPDYFMNNSYSHSCKPWLRKDVLDIADLMYALAMSSCKRTQCVRANGNSCIQRRKRALFGNSSQLCIMHKWWF